MRKALCVIFLFLFSCIAAIALGQSSKDRYENAVDLLIENKYEEAGKAFSALGGYKDSPQYTMYCNAVAAGEQGLYSIAVENLNSLNGFLDSSLLAVYYAGLSFEASENYEHACEVMSGITLFRDVAERIAGYPTLIKAREYRKADFAENAGRLEAALSGFKALGTYNDSVYRAAAVQEKIYARDYAAADKEEQENKLEEALEGFKALGTYKDSEDRAEAVQEKIYARDYAAADKAEQNGAFWKAYSGFVALGDYKDSAVRATAVKEKGKYEQAMQYALEGKFVEAYGLFTELGDYEDSEDKAYVLGVTKFAEVSDRKNGVAAFKFHNMWGVMNVNISTTTSPFWDEIGDFNQFGLAPVSKDDKHGYINKDGDVVISCEWDEIGEFNGFGLAPVSKRNKHGYINKDGDVVIPCEWYSVSQFNKDGLCTVCREKITGTGRDKKEYYYFGLYDSTGRKITSADWRMIGSSHNYDWDDKYNSAWTTIPLFNEGKIKVQNADGLYGFIDTEGNIVGEVKWNDIRDFSEGLAVVAKGKKYGFIDKNGNVVIQPQYADAYAFSENLAAVKINSFWQFINHDNEVIIQPRYSEVTSFSDGKADVFLPSTGWQIIDNTGKLIYFIKQSMIEGYQFAMEMFESGKYEEAIAAFEALEGYKDSVLKIEECRTSIKERDYQAALLLQQEGKPEEAITAFEALKGYKDSVLKIEECRTSIKERDYQAALSLQQEGKYEEAITAFKELNGYSDVAAQIKACRNGIEERDYQAALSLQQEGKYEEAITAFEALNGYSDAAAQIEACRNGIEERDYQAALSLQQAGKYEEAIAAFEALDGYSDAATQIEACRACIKERSYQAAVALQQAGRYDEALLAFDALNDYKDSTEKANEIYKDYLTSRIKKANVGDHVFFGSYEQDNNTSNGKERIEWLVLSKEKEKILLISRYALDSLPYHKSSASVTWEKCSLRKWLNDTFLNSAFNSDEQKLIQRTNVKADRNKKVKTSPGNNTTDKVFLLSINEAEKYFSNNEARLCQGTEYCYGKGVYKYSDGSYSWWLRSPGNYGSLSAFVRGESGDVNADGYYVIREFGVRPALWINLGS